MYFDIAMPVALFAVTMVATFLNGKVERKLKKTFEEREFGVKDAVMLVTAISVAVSLMVFAPQLAVIAIFVFAYAALLFIFTYLFSDFGKTKAQFFCAAFIAASFLAATVSLFSMDVLGGLSAYGAAAFYSLCGFSFIALTYEQTRTRAGRRWYLAFLPSALFMVLYAFYSRSPIWFPYLLNMYGIIFAVLVILYLGALFTWKTTLIFAGLLTVADIILVLVTRTMVSAATHVFALGLPVLVTLPTVPAITTSFGTLYMSLGLGDFFFAGLIAVQTYKKYGKNFAVLSAAAMAISFFIFEALILSFRLGAFPGTLMIICGWLPLLLLKVSKETKYAT
ncbi:MAG: hypothetical protein QXG76_02820 [Candidatus Bathyarchaeia archaeon]